MAKEAIIAGTKSGSGKAGLQQARSRSATAKMPRGGTTARQVIEVPGATLVESPVGPTNTTFKQTIDYLLQQVEFCPEDCT